MALNALLPEDIRILKVSMEADDFHARFSAKSKRYDYICTYEKKIHSYINIRKY